MEDFNVSKNLTEIMELMSLATDFIRTLRLKQLPSRLDLSLIFHHLPHLEKFEIVYG
jgi:hypothetical protein